MAEYREFKDGEDIAGTRYRALRMIGAGGMGSVYEVEHRELGKRFVLKALLRELARREDLVQRLRNEWRALGRLEHPNIVTVTDAGTSATGVPFYVMERLEGETLAHRMRRVRRFAVDHALDIVADILDGLSAAHEIGVVHRDIKPPNVFLSPRDRPKILDFGVAKIADDPGVVTARGLAVGTPRYMSPEQARGEPVDGRADIYSSGLLLFEMIAGVGPFDDSRDANELILAHIARVAPPLSSVAMGVPPELDAAVAAMLEKDYRKRPATARDCARLLRGIRAHLTESASSHMAVATDTRGSALPAGMESRAHGDDTTRPEGVVRPSGTTRTSLSQAPWSTTSGVPSSGTIVTPMTTVAAQAVMFGAPNAPARTVRVAPLVPPNTIPDAMSQMEPSSEFGARLRTPAPAWVPTEVLTAIPTDDAKPTRTNLPRPEAPSSVTPPPISPLAEPWRTPPPPRQRAGFLMWAVAGGALAAGFLSVMLVTSRRSAEPSSSATQPVATGSALEAIENAAPTAAAPAASERPSEGAPASALGAHGESVGLPEGRAEDSRSSAGTSAGVTRGKTAASTVTSSERQARPSSAPAKGANRRQSPTPNTAVSQPKVALTSASARLEQANPPAETKTPVAPRRLPESGLLPGSGL